MSSYYDENVMGQKMGKLGFISDHLWIEKMLSLCLEHELPNPNALFRERGVSFSQLLTLCEAHLIVDGDLAVAVRELNRLRNKCAHQLEFDLSDDAFRPLSQKLTALGIAFEAGDWLPRHLADLIEKIAIDRGSLLPYQSGENKTQHHKSDRAGGSEA